MSKRRFSTSSSDQLFSGNLTRRPASGLLLAAAAAALGFSSIASADPLPGEVLKFYQAPLNNAAPIYPPGSAPTSLDIPASPRFTGHDELSTADFNTTNPNGPGYAGTMMADDFGDFLTTPIVHVMFWGSYMNNTVPPAGVAGVKQFQITFYTENPAGPAGNFSTPLIPYSSQTVTLTTAKLAPASGTFTETPVAGTTGAAGTGDSGLFQYNAELAVPAAEPVANGATGGPVPGPIGTVDWISIVALVGGPAGGNPNVQWGWHDRDYGMFDPLAIGANPTGPGEHNLNPGLVDPPQQPVWHFQDDAVSNPTFALPLAAGALPSSLPTAKTPPNYLPGIDIASSTPYSKDLAFALYTVVPEPASLCLVAVAGLATLGRRNRKPS